MTGSALPIADPIVIFAIVACLILVVPFAAAKVKLPSLVGLLLAGAILGPNALHVLERDQSFILLGKVGLMFIMFIAALEVDLGVFKKFGVHAAVFGLLTFGIPLAAAAPVALYVLGYSTLAGVLLASVFSSHTLLAYPMASRLGITKNRAVTTAVGGTMIADTSALLLLAVIVGIKVGGHIDEAFWLRLLVSLSIYAALIFFGLPGVGRWLFRRFNEDGNVQFAFVLAAVFVSAGLAEPAGVEPIVGAFLAGLALNRLIPHNGTLMNRIGFAGEAVFIPFFLISVGMLLDARVLVTGFGTWLLVIYMTVMVIVTKFIAAEATRLILRFDKAEARVVFSLTLAQAAATLAVVQVGFNVGLFDKTVVNGSIVMILVTCTISPMVMARFGPEVARREAMASANEHVGPRQRILVGLRSLVTAQPMIELALLMRDTSKRQPLFLVHAARDDADVERTVRQADKMLHDAVVLCSAADVPAEVSTSIDLTVGAALVRSTKELQTTHLVLDWDFAASATTGAVLGSTIDELVRTAQGSLLFFRSRHPVSTTRRVTMAIPPVAFARETLGAAVAAIKHVAHQLGAPIEILAEATTWADCRAAVESAKPEVKLEPHGLERWASLGQALLDRTSTSDMLVILGSRDAPPPIARTSVEVAARFPEASVVLVFGPRTPPSANASAVLAPKPAPSPSPSGVSGAAPRDT